MVDELTFASSAGLLNVNLNFVRNISEAKLSKNDSLLILGKAQDLKSLNDCPQLSTALASLNIPQTWLKESISYLCPAKKEETTDSAKPASGSSVSWLNKLCIHKISNKFSRANAPSRASSIPKLIRKSTYSENQHILVVCPRKHAIAIVSAIARTYPLYSTKTSKNDPAKTRFVSVSFLFDTDATAATDAETATFNILAQSVRLTAKIVDMPCSEMNTDSFLNEIKIVAKSLDLEPMVIEGEELNKRGFGGIYNVGKAALNSPKLVVLSHLRPAAVRTVAWVGKGIVYDTGGLCIKSRAGMCTMKHDCGGAAAILGAFNTAVQMGFKDNLHAVFCLAENAVGPIAYRPDDIIKLYSGKTVEITNTDAEGRLVLGDGVAFAEKDLKADIIIDMATLTGAQGIATGKHHAAVLTNNGKWEQACVEAGRSSADLCFPIVFAPELHFSQFESELADMTNSVSKGDNAPSSCAGLFIHSHLSAKYEGVWVHIDMASMVAESERGTGFGVALLNSLFGSSFTNRSFELVAPVAEMPVRNDEKNEESED